MSNSAPAGWYTDLTSPAQMRWWDGNAWTDHTSSPGTADAEFNVVDSNKAPVHRTWSRGRVAWIMALLAALGLLARPMTARWIVVVLGVLLFLSLPIPQFKGRWKYLAVMSVLVAVLTFTFMTTWFRAHTEIITARGVGAYDIGARLVDLETRGLVDKSAVDSTLVETKLDGVYLKVAGGVVDAINMASGGPTTPASPWQTRAGISVTSSAQDLIETYRGGASADSSFGSSVAWVPYGSNALLLTNYGDGSSELEIGKVSLIQSEYAEAIAPAPSPPTGPPESTGDPKEDFFQSCMYAEEHNEIPGADQLTPEQWYIVCDSLTQVKFGPG